MDKSYKLKYGESPILNLNEVKDNGLSQFIEAKKEKWKCKNCGQLLCVHREVCVSCGIKNDYFPQINA